MAKPCGRSSRSTRRSTPPDLPSPAAGAWANAGAARARMARAMPSRGLARMSDLRARVEAQSHLGLEDLERVGIDGLDLLRDGRGQADIVAVVDAARDDGE